MTDLQLVLHHTELPLLDETVVQVGLQRGYHLSVLADQGPELVPLTPQSLGLLLVEGQGLLQAAQLISLITVTHRVFISYLSSDTPLRDIVFC